MSSHCNNNIEQELIALYTKLAKQPQSDFGWNKGKSNAQQLGYSNAWIKCLPDIVWESAAAVGNPFKLGKINSGETVLDVGCGAGADSCVAALLVGNTGQVIGIDCTPAMIEKAKTNAHHAKLSNVAFYEADIASLPIEDNSIDVVISNGAINLSIDKEKVFLELYRVLKPGGRLLFADMIRIESDCDISDSNTETWANCVQGTLSPDKLLSIINSAGFDNIELVELTDYKTSNLTSGALFRAKKRV